MFRKWTNTPALTLFSFLVCIFTRWNQRLKSLVKFGKWLIQINSRLPNKSCTTPPPKTKYCWGMLIIVPAAYQTCWTWCLSHNAARGFRFLFISPFDAPLIFWCGQVKFWDSSLSCVVNSVLYFSEQIPCSLDMLSKAYERYQTQQTPDSARSIVCYISHWQTSSLCITSSPL